MRTPPPAQMARGLRVLGAGMVLALLAAVLPGCSVLGFGGAMIESSRRNSTKEIAAEYTGLKGKKWAVVVVADRVIQAEYPDVVLYLTSQITDRLSDPKGAHKEIAAAGFIPAQPLLSYLYEHPRWITMTRGDLAKELGVDRLIVVELIEYRLNDPGNQYLWAGQATGSVGVIEADSALPDEFAFEKPISVRFPDKDSFGPNDMSSQVVATALGKRFIDRCSWLFYKHDEKYYPDY